MPQSVALINCKNVWSLKGQLTQARYFRQSSLFNKQNKFYLPLQLLEWSCINGKCRIKVVKLNIHNSWSRGSFEIQRRVTFSDIFISRTKNRDVHSHSLMSFLPQLEQCRHISLISNILTLTHSLSPSWCFNDHSKSRSYEWSQFCFDWGFL